MTVTRPDISYLYQLLGMIYFGKRIYPMQGLQFTQFTIYFIIAN